METRSISTLPNGRVRRNGKPEGVFGFIRHDFDVFGCSRPTRNKAGPEHKSLPETLPAMTRFDRVKMTPSLEFYWFDIFKSYAPSNMDLETVKKQWWSFMKGDRVITNSQGSDSRASYVCGTNLDAQPIGVQTLLMGGAITELVSTAKVIERYREEDGSLVETECYRAYCINALKPLPIIQRYTDGRNGRVYGATLSYRDDYNDQTHTWGREDRVTPFWQLDGNFVPTLFIANEDTVLLPASRVRVLKEDEVVPGPYHP